jgi:uncharacterized protein YbcI
MTEAVKRSGAAPDPEGAQYPNDELTRVCGEVAAVFRRAWGRGPARTTAHWAGPDMLVVLLANGHTDAEKTLRAAGHIQELLGGRHLLQAIIEDDLKAGVERILGRTVKTTLSATRLDPDLSAEIFLLVPSATESQRPT